jgi:malonate transporter and related proteins
MNLAGLVGALLPVFFVLALGYVAGKRDAFDADQAAGLSKLAVSFALPASLFVGMTEIPRNLLLQQGRLVLALLLAHVGLFFVAWAALGFIQNVRGTPAILYALMLSTSATPVFGLAVLQPILGPAATGAVGLVALSINLVVPATVVLLEVDAAKHRGGIAKDCATSSPVLTGLASGLKSPLLWAPIVGIAIVLAKVPLPRVIAACFQLIGSTTSGVAVFAVGLVLAAHAFQFSRVVFFGTLGRLTVQNVVLLALLRLLHVDSPFTREALICCSFPLATVVVLFAARYKSSESETASMLLFSTLSLAVTVPIILWLTNHWPV